MFHNSQGRVTRKQGRRNRYTNIIEKRNKINLLTIVYERKNTGRHPRLISHKATRHSEAKIYSVKVQRERGQAAIH